MPARCRIATGEIYAGCFTKQTAPTIAANQILRPQRAVGRLDFDARAVLRDADDFTPALEFYPQLVHPAGEKAFNVILAKPKPIGMPRGKVADVQSSPAASCDLSDLSL